MSNTKIDTEVSEERSKRNSKRLLISLSCLGAGMLLFSASTFYATVLFRREAFRGPMLSNAMGVALYAGIGLAILGCAMLLTSQNKKSETPKNKQISPLLGGVAVGGAVIVLIIYVWHNVFRALLVGGLAFGLVFVGMWIRQILARRR